MSGDDRFYHKGCMNNECFFASFNFFILYYQVQGEKCSTKKITVPRILPGSEGGFVRVSHLCDKLGLSREDCRQSFSLESSTFNKNMILY